MDIALLHVNVIIMHRHSLALRQRRSAVPHFLNNDTSFWNPIITHACRPGGACASYINHEHIPICRLSVASLGLSQSAGIIYYCCSISRRATVTFLYCVWSCNSWKYPPQSQNPGYAHRPCRDLIHRLSWCYDAKQNGKCKAFLSMLSIRGACGLDLSCWYTLQSSVTCHHTSLGWKSILILEYLIHNSLCRGLY